MPLFTTILKAAFWYLVIPGAAAYLGASIAVMVLPFEPAFAMFLGALVGIGFVVAGYSRGR